MADVYNLLEQIGSAIYGEGVRGSIHDAIEQCYADATGNPASLSNLISSLHDLGDITEMDATTVGPIAPETGYSFEDNTIYLSPGAWLIEFGISVDTSAGTSGAKGILTFDSIDPNWEHPDQERYFNYEYEIPNTFRHYVFVDEDNPIWDNIIEEGDNQGKAPVDLYLWNDANGCSINVNLFARALCLKKQGSDEPGGSIEEDIAMIHEEISLLNNASLELDDDGRLKISGLSSNTPEVNDRIEIVEQGLSTEISARSSADSDLSNQIAVERSRISNLASLEEGSTTGDAELIDIRTGADSNIYESAGDAVRGQISDLKSDLEKELKLQNVGVQLFDMNDKNMILNGYITSVSGNIEFRENNSTKTICIPILPKTYYLLSRDTGFHANTVAYSPVIPTNGTPITFISASKTETIDNRLYNLYYANNEQAKYLLIYCYNANHDVSADSVLESIQISRLDSYAQQNKYINTDYTKSVAMNPFTESNEPLIGQEILAADGWTLNSGWTGNYAEGFTHASGYEETLEFELSSTSANNFYLVQLDVSGNRRGGTSDFYVSVCGSSLFETYIGDAQSTSYLFVVKSSGASGFSIIPRKDFAGVFTNISLKRIYGGNSANFENELFRMYYDENSNLMVGKRNGLVAFGGYGNTSFGNDAFRSLLSGFWNTAIGERTLSNCLNGSRNVGIGYNSLYNTTQGDRNVGVGTFSLQANTIGRKNIGIGADSLQFNTIGNNNIGIGTCAGYGINTGSDNISIGSDTQYENSNGGKNVSIGFQAQYFGVANQNVAIGYEALNRGGTGGNNVAIGYRGGKKSIGGRNVFVGANADADSSTPSVTDSIALGYNCKAKKSNQMVLGSSDITEVVMCGNKKIIFNSDGTVTWEEIS